MFNRSKIIKKGDAKVTELEEECAKALQHFEQANKDLAGHLRLVFLNSVEEVEFTQKDGSASKYILVRIPFRSLQAFRKVGDKVIDVLESKFKWPVMISANRTIISTRAVNHPSQKRPRSRTLKAVHAAILEDIVAPSFVTGRNMRCTVEGRRFENVLLDPLDKDVMEPRLEAMSACYKKLTTHTLHFDFSKPNNFQKKKIEAAKATKK